VQADWVHSRQGIERTVHVKQGQVSGPSKGFFSQRKLDVMIGAGLRKPQAISEIGASLHKPHEMDKISATLKKAHARKNVWLMLSS
jgi:hypothetical protein